MYGRVSHHPTLANILSSCFELRLHERHTISVGIQHPGGNGKDQRKRYERDIDHHEINRLRQRLEISRIHPFFNDDAWIIAELLVDLSVANVDRKNLAGAALDQAIRKSAGACAQIGADEPPHINLEFLKRMNELLAAPADETWLGLERDLI